MKSCIKRKFWAEFRFFPADNTYSSVKNGAQNLTY